MAAKRADLDRGQVIGERAGTRSLGAWLPGYYASTARLVERTRVAYEAAWRLRVQLRSGQFRCAGSGPATSRTGYRSR